MSTPYFYIIRDVISGKRYAGAKWASDADPTSFMTIDGYKTSSPTIKHLIKINGIESFVVERIITDFGGMSAKEFETAFLLENNCASSPLWFNQHNNNNFKTPDFESHEWKQMMIDKYGVDNYSKLPETKINLRENAKLQAQRQIAKNPNFFKNNAEKTKEKLIEKYGISNPAYSKEFMQKMIDTKHNNPHLFCEKCGERFKYQAHLQNHIKNDCGKIKTKSTEEIISAIDRATQQWNNRSEEEKMRVINKSAETTKQKYRTRHTCENCGKSYRFLKSLIRHKNGWGNCVTQES